MGDIPESLRALAETGVALARRTACGRVVFAKLAGVLHPDLLPEVLLGPVRAELDAALAATAVELDAKTVERALKAAWRRPADHVLADGVAPEPLAVTPTAQVHAGVLDGEPVAVKLARPGLAAAVRGELALLDVLGGPLAAAFPALDAAAALRALREAALDELDLEHEGDQQQRARRALRRVDGVVVPAVHGELSAGDVLVTERLEGPTLAEAAPADAEATARHLVAAHLSAWREAGLVLTDTRPSHVILLADGRTGLLGTGVARPAPRERAAATATAFVALADPDPDAFAEVVADELAVLDAAAARDAHGVLRAVLGPVLEGPYRLDGPALAALGARAREQAGALLAIAARATPEPSDLAAARAFGQLAATLSRLAPELDWVALARDASAT